MGQTHILSRPLMSMLWLTAMVSSPVLIEIKLVVLIVALVEEHGLLDHVEDLVTCYALLPLWYYAWSRILSSGLLPLISSKSLQHSSQRWSGYLPTERWLRPTHLDGEFPSDWNISRQLCGGHRTVFYCDDCGWLGRAHGRYWYLS